MEPLMASASLQKSGRCTDFFSLSLYIRAQQEGVQLQAGNGHL